MGMRPRKGHCTTLMPQMWMTTKLPPPPPQPRYVLCVNRASFNVLHYFDRVLCWRWCLDLICFVLGVAVCCFSFRFSVFNFVLICFVFCVLCFLFCFVLFCFVLFHVFVLIPPVFFCVFLRFIRIICFQMEQLYLDDVDLPSDDDDDEDDEDDDDDDDGGAASARPATARYQ
jgi:hypothetical protein